MESPPSAFAPAPPDSSDDDSLILWMLSLSAAERLEVLQGFVDSASELQREQDAPV
jgi:hypothetical protein